jgi:hypothetical protein
MAITVEYICADYRIYKVLVITTRPERAIYQDWLTGMFTDDVQLDVYWQTNVEDMPSFHAIIASEQSYGVLPRGRTVLDDYVRQGGRLYLMGAAPFYLNYTSELPQSLPGWIGLERYDEYIGQDGAIISDDQNSMLASFNSRAVVPSSNLDVQTAESVVARFGTDRAAAKRATYGSGRIAWSAFGFVNNMTHPYLSNFDGWNELVTGQIVWLLGL